jgi:hypothetical protein
MLIRKNQNLRFWVFVNGWTKITIKPGQVLRHVQGGPCEEGSAWSAREFYGYIDRNDELRAAMDVHHWGRDCDGGYQSHQELHCLEGKLKAEVIEDDDGEKYAVPEWQDGDSSHWDEYAASAGY